MDEEDLQYGTKAEQAELLQKVSGILVALPALINDLLYIL